MFVTTKHTRKIKKKMIFIEREALCDSAVTDWTLDFNSVNCWKGQSDVVVWLKHSLYLAPIRKRFLRDGGSYSSFWLCYLEIAT